MKERITASPDVLFGKPRINGTRISVDQILSMLGEGHNFAEILKEFPDITEEDIRACVAYANNLVVNVHVVTSTKSSDAEISH